MQPPPELTTTEMQEGKKILLIFVEKFFEQEQVSFPPTILLMCFDPVIEARKNIIAGVPGNFNTEEQKEVVLTILAERCVENQLFPMAILMASEAWMVIATRDGITCMPSQHPDRKEAIVIQGVDISQKLGFLGCAEIARNQNNTIKIGKFDFPEYTDIQPQLLLKFFIAYRNRLMKDATEFLTKQVNMGAILN
jgi:hypothetical protein